MLSGLPAKPVRKRDLTGRWRNHPFIHCRVSLGAWHTYKTRQAHRVPLGLYYDNAFVSFPAHQLFRQVKEWKLLSAVCCTGFLSKLSACSLRWAKFSFQKYSGFSRSEKFTELLFFFFRQGSIHEHKIVVVYFFNVYHSWNF